MSNSVTDGTAQFNTRSKVYDKKSSTPTVSKTSSNTKSIANVKNTLDDNKSIQFLVNQNSEIIKKLTALERSVEFLSGQYDEMKIIYEKIIQENTSLKKINAQVTNKMEQITTENLNLQQNINQIKQNEIKNNIVIFGIPNQKDNHSLNTAFNNILSETNMSTDAVEIDDIYQKKTQTDQAPIFIKFRNFKNKIDFKQSIKAYTSINKKCLHTADLGYTKNNKVIFADQLTDTNQNLLREAKTLRVHGYKYIWTSNGKVLVKKDDNRDTSPIIIKNCNCIESLKNVNSTI